VPRKTPRKLAWRAEAIPFLREYQARHLMAFCSLPDLFRSVVEKHGMTIGQFHDGIRDLVKEGQLRLHPFSGARSALEHDEYALVAQREIMYYVEAIV